MLAAARATLLVVVSVRAALSIDEGRVVEKDGDWKDEEEMRKN